MSYKVEISGMEDLQRKLGGLAAAVSPGEVATAAGREVVLVYMPQLFKTNGFGTWPALKLRPGQPLSDTGRLRDSWSYRSSLATKGVEIFNSAPFAEVHDKGMTIRAKPGKVMFIPNPNYWGNSERRTMSIRDMLARVKATAARDKYSYLNAKDKAFWKSRQQGRDKYAILNKRDRPFYFAKSVSIPERSMTKIRPEMYAAAIKGVEKMIKIAVKGANG